MRLLIVDDSELLRERIRLSVSAISPETEIREAATLEEGRRGCREFLPQVAVLDIQLPDGNGYDLLRQIKVEKKCSCVVILSNHPFYRKKCLAAGADFFFDKSDEFERFVETVGKVIA